MLAPLISGCAPESTSSIQYEVLDGLSYVITNDRSECYVKAASNNLEGEVVIPSSYKGVPVKTILNYAFKDCTKITSISIPSSIKTIDRMAFYNCKSLEKINIPYNCNLEAVEYRSFYNCISLTTIDIPSSVTTIKDYAFESCLSLETITFGPSSKLTSIGEYAFKKCDSLVSLNIPKSVSSLSSTSFSECSSLSNLVIEVGNANYLSNNGMIYTADHKQLVFVPKSLTGEVRILDGITSIKESLFSGCRFITSVTLPNTITKIESRAFFDCYALEEVTFPSSLTDIGEYAFANCKSLKNVTLNDGLLYIRESAFSCCYGLQRIVFPSSLSLLGEDALFSCYSLISVIIPDDIRITEYFRGTFYGCSSLNSITIPASLEDIDLEAFTLTSDLDRFEVSENNENYSSINGVLYSKDGKTLIRYPMGKKDAKFIVPKEVTALDSASFTDTVYLKNLAFAGGIALSIIPDNVFSNSQALETITFPQSVRIIKPSCLDNCDSLKAINLAGINVTYSSQNGILFNKTKTKIIIVPKQIEGDLLMPIKLDSLADKQFVGCPKLKSMLFVASAKLTEIGEYAISDCESFESITLPASLLSISSHAFDNCPRLDEINYWGTVEEFKAIEKDEMWCDNISARVVTCSDGEYNIVEEASHEEN